MLKASQFVTLLVAAPSCDRGHTHGNDVSLCTQRTAQCTTMTQFRTTQFAGACACGRARRHVKMYGYLVRL